MDGSIGYWPAFLFLGFMGDVGMASLVACPLPGVWLLPFILLVFILVEVGRHSFLFWEVRGMACLMAVLCGGCGYFLFKLLS